LWVNPVIRLYPVVDDALFFGLTICCHV